MMAHSLRRAACLAVLTAVQGCSVFTNPKQKPVIEDRVTDWGLPKVGILATTPERRVVLVRMPDKVLCSEAPADVGESVASAISASLEAEASGKLSSAQGGVSQQLATSILQLTHRSQGMQFYRDASYHLCIMFMNGVMSAQDIRSRHDELVKMSDALIRLEIPEIAEIKKAASAHLAAPAVPAAAELPAKK